MEGGSLHYVDLFKEFLESRWQTLSTEMGLCLFSPALYTPTAAPGASGAPGAPGAASAPAVGHQILSFLFYIFHISTAEDSQEDEIEIKKERRRKVNTR